MVSFMKIGGKSYFLFIFLGGFFFGLFKFYFFGRWSWRGLRVGLYELVWGFRRGFEVYIFAWVGKVIFLVFLRIVSVFKFVRVVFLRYLFERMCFVFFFISFLNISSFFLICVFILFRCINLVGF